MAKVYLDPGHGGAQPGAVKYVVEKDVNLVQALACRDYLIANGVQVKMSRTGDTNTDIGRSCSEANAWGADIAVSIHNNAGGGDGFEVYYGIGSTIKGSLGLATYIEQEVVKIGQNTRGKKVRRGKNGDYYQFIRQTKMPSIICEGAFVDNKTDVAIIDTKAEQQAFGYAYARGILKYLGIADKGLNGGKTEPKPTPSKPAVVDGLYLVRVLDEIDIYKAPLEKNGKCPKGAYTIIEEKNGYGKLKSSTEKDPRWIDLSKVKKI